MGVVAIVVRQPSLQSFLERGSTGKIAAFQEAPTQDAEE
jgi:hypothetical protein